MFTKSANDLTNGGWIIEPILHQVYAWSSHFTRSPWQNNMYYSGECHPHWVHLHALFFVVVVFCLVGFWDFVYSVNPLCACTFQLSKKKKLNDFKPTCIKLLGKNPWYPSVCDPKRFNCICLMSCSSIFKNWLSAGDSQVLDWEHR